MILEIIEQHKATYDRNNVRDFVDAYLLHIEDVSLSLCIKWFERGKALTSTDKSRHQQKQTSAETNISRNNLLDFRHNIVSFCLRKTITTKEQRPVVSTSSSFCRVAIQYHFWPVYQHQILVLKLARDSILTSRIQQLIGPTLNSLLNGVQSFGLKMGPNIGPKTRQILNNCHPGADRHLPRGSRHRDQHAALCNLLHSQQPRSSGEGAAGNKRGCRPRATAIVGRQGGNSIDLLRFSPSSFGWNLIFLKLMHSIAVRVAEEVL